MLGKKQKKVTVVKENKKHFIPKIEFDKNSRAFFKKYTQSITGPQKFVLVVAFLVKGKIKVNILFREIERIWNMNSGLLGGKLTARIYGTRAKEKEDSTKNGVYMLTEKWIEIFS